MAPIHRPSLGRLVTEAPRAGLDLGAVWPLLATARRGDGHPVLVLPGWLTGDPATALMRSVLRALGHNVSGWSLGANRGPTVHVVQELRQQVERLHRNSGRRVSLVGWSLGGLYAQELARASPGSVRGLVTLASPVTRWPQWMRTASGVADHGTRVPRALASLPRPWAERGSHLGTGHNPAVLWLLADRLGMAEGAWTPFRPPLGLRPFFPRR